MNKEEIRLVKEIRALINENKTTELKKRINEIEEYLLADIIEVLEAKNQVVVFRLLDKDRALAVFEHVETEFQQELLQNFTDEKAVEFFKGLEPDDRAKLMDELPAKVAKRLIGSLSKEEKEFTLLVMGYEPGTAGHVMTPKYVRLKEDVTIDEALEQLREIGKKVETLYNIYVTDNERRLEGVVSLREIVTAEPGAVVGDVMTKDPIKVTYDTADEDVARLLQDSDLISVPVVDKENRLLGAVTVDDAMDVLAEEATEDALSKAGFAGTGQKDADRSQLLTSGSLWQVWRIRMPFLFVALAGGMIAGMFIEQFEETLATIYVLAFFIPVIMDMGGNVGTQSATIFTRAVVLGQIDFKRFMKQWLREIGIGFSMGIVYGIVGGFIVYLWQGGLDYAFNLAIVISLALTFTITIASALGFFVPFVLIKLGLDQAAGANPFITTLKDITGLLIYFLLATWMLPV